jgi:hypothetical protein
MSPAYAFKQRIKGEIENIILLEHAKKQKEEKSGDDTADKKKKSKHDQINERFHKIADITFSYNND